MNTREKLDWLEDSLGKGGSRMAALLMDWFIDEPFPDEDGFDEDKFNAAWDAALEQTNEMMCQMVDVDWPAVAAQHGVVLEPESGPGFDLHGDKPCYAMRLDGGGLLLWADGKSAVLAPQEGERIECRFTFDDTLCHDASPAG